MDGTEVRLYNHIASAGKWDVTTQSYIYRGVYPIGISEEKLLRSVEADHIRVHWSKAQDQYEIFELDFFINHFNCLENG